MGQNWFSLALRQAAFLLALIVMSFTGIPELAHAGEWIEGRVTHVRDVDTIEVNGLAIRLNGVDGLELDERGGQAGKRWMQKLVLRKPVRCWLNGDRTYDRWVGICHDSAGRDIGAIAIASGMARDCPRYSGGKYGKYETEDSRRLPRHGYCR